MSNVARVGHFQQQRSVWSIATGNLLTLSEQQLVNCSLLIPLVTVISRTMDLLLPRRTPFARKPVTASPQQRGFARIRVPLSTASREVSRDTRACPVSAVARQPVSAAIKTEQASFQSYRPGVHGNNRLGENSLPCERAFAFQHSRWAKGDKVSLVKCMEVPESCSAGVDEMRDMASTIRTEVVTELNVTCKRLHQIASDFVDCNTLTSQVSSHRSTFRAKMKSHTSCRKQQHAENDVSMACAKF